MIYRQTKPYEMCPSARTVRVRDNSCWDNRLLAVSRLNGMRDSIHGESPFRLIARLKLKKNVSLVSPSPVVDV